MKSGKVTFNLSGVIEIIEPEVPSAESCAGLALEGLETVLDCFGINKGELGVPPIVDAVALEARAKERLVKHSKIKES